MRPPIPDIPLSQSRKSSFEQPRTDPRCETPATFFLSRSSGFHSTESPLQDSDTTRDSMYGVQSLDDAVREASLDASYSETAHSVISMPHSQRDNLHDNNDDDDDDDDDGAALTTHRGPAEPSASKPFHSPLHYASDDLPSCPLTPLNLSFQNASSSLPSSPKSTSNNSLKPLDDISITDDLSSQAVASAEEDNDLREAPTSNPDGTSQLIMPSIRMPSRRPFTERGKVMGRLKLVVAGASGESCTNFLVGNVCTTFAGIQTDC